MRIAHIITRMVVGGAQENTLLTCRDLIEIHGDEVLLLAGPSLGPEGGLLELSPAPELPLQLVPSLRRAIHPWRDLRCYGALKKAIRQFQPDVVHTHSAKGGFLGRLAANAVGVPVVVHTVHGAPFHQYQGRGPRSLFRWCERYAARRCHALISVADAMTDLLVESRVAPREKFTTIYSGMEVEPFLAADQHRQRMRSELGYKDEHVVVGKIARLFYLKGHEYVIAAAQRVVKQCPNVRFLMIGDGLLRERLERQISAAGLTDYFHFTGLVPPRQIPHWISAMDVLLHASLREGLARALPQALLAGKPVVSFDIDGAREVVLPGQTGYLPQAMDVSGMTDALIELAGDSELRRRLGVCGRERVTQPFQHQFMTSRIRQLYQRLLEEHGRDKIAN